MGHLTMTEVFGKGIGRPRKAALDVAVPFGASLQKLKALVSADSVDAYQRNTHAHQQAYPLHRSLSVARSLASLRRTSMLSDRIPSRGMTGCQGCARPYSTLTLPPLCLRGSYTKNRMARVRLSHC